MKTVIYREQVVIDGRVYDLTTCDYSETVAEWIADGTLPLDAADQHICDYITDDIVNSSL